MKQVCVFLADGFEEVEALTAVDLLRRARIYVDTVSITDDYKVHGAHGINVQTEDLFDEVDFNEFDMIVLPGGMPGTLNLGANSYVQSVIADFAEKGKLVAAICAAPSVLGEAGLLQGKKATSYPGFEEKLLGAETSLNPVVVDGNIITSRGMGTAIPFALEIVAYLLGEDKAEEIRKGIIYGN